MAIGYIVLHFTYIHKTFKGRTYETFEFKALDGKTYLSALGYIGIFVAILIFTNFCLTIIPGSIDLDVFILLQVSRTILTEELVFRGLALTVFLIMFNKIFKLDMKISIIASIAISSLIFGGLHYFKFAQMELGQVEIVTSVIFLSVLGILCGILKVKFGLWAAMLLHIINNIIAIFSGGVFISLQDNSVSSLFLRILFFLIIAVVSYLFVMKYRGGAFNFGYFGVSLIASFIFGFYTNGMFSVNFAKIEHYHLIIFLPILYYIFRNKFHERKRAISIMVGFLFGLFVSDYVDFINQPLPELGLFVFVLLTELLILTYYNSISSIIKKRKN